MAPNSVSFHHSGVMQPEAMRKAMLDRVPKGTEELNKKAFEEGYNMFKDAPAHI